MTMQILTAADMAETDRRTWQAFGISLATLMENAGTAVAWFILRQYPDSEARRVLVLCGKGNNGGDGLVAARVLAEHGRQITVALLGQEADLKGEAATALARLHASPAAPELRSLTDEAALNALGLSSQPGSQPGVQPGSHQGIQAPAAYDLIVDAVLGTGFKPPLRGLAAALRDRLASPDCTIPVVAVDLPTGWDADSTAQTVPDAFPANAVVTFTAPKLAHVFGHLTPRQPFGPVVVAPIGSPPKAVVSSTSLTWTGTAKVIAEVPRDINANKGRFGHVLVLGGSYGTAGAPSMAALAALRTGAGLVTAAVPDSILNLVAQIAPELMLAPLIQGPEGAVAFANLAPGCDSDSDGRLPELLKSKRITVLAVGPGLSTRGEASQFARQLVATTQLPLVLDADALNAFAGNAALLNGEGRTLVLTPHPGEMARLLGLTVKEVEADRLNLARRFAIDHRLTLVLKGWRTLIAHPDGSVAVNTSGNPALAKGGSGDILTGIVAALLAQFPDNAAHAVETAVYLHGLAADFAAHALDEHTVLATDTLAHLTDAFRYRACDHTSGSDGLTWITGVQPAALNSHSFPGKNGRKNA
jgi:ADP-dependent NAD(P)H-hydrate dehydratase / NAD(P)H-hydrate epimerase